MKILILLMALFLILFEAISEGLRDRGKKTLAGVVQFIYLCVVTTAVLALFTGTQIVNYYPHLLYVLGGYVLLRYSIFDLAYNLSAGNDPFYIGNTKLYDRAWQWFFRVTGFPPTHFLWLTKLISALIGVTWLTDL